MRNSLAHINTVSRQHANKQHHMKSHTIETQFVRYIVPILAALFWAGCSGAPSESAGKQVIEDKIQAHKKADLIKLVSFRKTNGSRDGNSYQMECEVEIEFLDNCRFVDSTPQGYYVVRDNEPGKPQGSVVVQKRKGEKLQWREKLKFQKTEKGWRGVW
jgi:hypothetical protein